MAEVEQEFKNIVKQYKQGDIDIFNKYIKYSNGIYIFYNGAKIFNSFLYYYLIDYSRYFSREEIASIFIFGFSIALEKIVKYNDNAGVIEYFKNTIRNTFLNEYNKNFNNGTVPSKEGKYNKYIVISIDQQIENAINKEKDEKAIISDTHINDFFNKTKNNTSINTSKFSKLINEHCDEIKLTARQEQVFLLYLKGLRSSEIAKELYPDLPPKKRNKKVDKVRREIQKGLIKLAYKHKTDITNYLANKKKNEICFTIPEYQHDIEILEHMLAKIERTVNFKSNIKEQIKPDFDQVYEQKRGYYAQKICLTRFITHAKSEMRFMYRYYYKYGKNIFKNVKYYLIL